MKLRVSSGYILTTSLTSPASEGEKLPYCSGGATPKLPIHSCSLWFALLDCCGVGWLGMCNLWEKQCRSMGLGVWLSTNETRWRFAQCVGCRPRTHKSCTYSCGVVNSKGVTTTSWFEKDEIPSVPNYLVNAGAGEWASTRQKGQKIL